MWYYKQTEPQLWTVIHGEGSTRTTDSDHDTRESAAARVAYLNGSGKAADGEVVSLLREIIELSALSNLKSDDPINRLATIFRKAVHVGLEHQR